MSASDLRVIFCTAPSDAAPALARKLLEARLIGCVNLIPGVRSLYWWEGEIKDEGEVLMIMESPHDRADEAVAVLAEAHPYDVPKLLLLEPRSINDPYLAWLREVTRPA